MEQNSTSGTNITNTTREQQPKRTHHTMLTTAQNAPSQQVHYPHMAQLLHHTHHGTANDFNKHLYAQILYQLTIFTARIKHSTSTPTNDKYARHVLIDTALHTHRTWFTSGYTNNYNYHTQHITQQHGHKHLTCLLLITYDRQHHTRYYQLYHCVAIHSAAASLADVGVITCESS